MTSRVPAQRRDQFLLPADNSRAASDQGEDGPSGGSGSGKKRSKVTAVACQPCQKRKSKCDGRRPVCTSCEQKGRIDCVYDSSSDLRRTSALKQRIDGLQSEVNDLRDILLALCDAHVSGNTISAVNLIHNHVGTGDFSHTQDLAQILRSNTNLRQLNPQTHANFQQGGMAHAANTYVSAPPTQSQHHQNHHYGVQYQGAEQDGVNMSPRPNEHPEWSLGGGNEASGGGSHQQGYAGTYG